MMRATPLMLAIALGLGLPANDIARAATPGGSVAARSDVRQSWIVQFEEPALPSFRGFDGKDSKRPRLAATSPAVTGARQFNAASAEAVAYRQYLVDLRKVRLNEASARIGRTITPSFVYEYAINGMAVVLTPAEAALLAKVPGVKRVSPDFVRYPMTDRGPAWIKADQIWSGAANNGTARRGEGVIIGVIDGGINPSHQSFAATGPRDGYVHTNPKGTFLGNTSTPKNNKLIGIYDFTTEGGDEPNNGLDTDGHGTHTASTAGGNLVAFSPGPDPDRHPDFSGDMSGVAPRANIISYKACEVEASCVGSWLVASINQAIADGVHVINYSIGGAPFDPWAFIGDDRVDDAEAFLSAREAGIVVAAAAGNDGPDAGTHSNPANAPWVMGVAAASHDRALVNRLQLTGGNTPLPGGGILTGAGGSSGTGVLGQRAIIEATDFPLCGTGSNTSDGLPAPWANGTRFANQIVICQRGFYDRIAKSRNVRIGCNNSPGSCGTVLANQPSDGNSVLSDPHTTPAIHLTASDSAALMAWVRSGSGHTGQLLGSQLGSLPSAGDELADFSGRGPVGPMGVLKPDLTAPGRRILAAGHTNTTEAVFESGTSMATPHVAGAAALLKSTNPALTANQIISALTLTARNSVRLQSGAAATPHEQGAGTVDLAKAIKAGLYLDVTGPQFRAADPSLPTPGSPESLNLPTLARESCNDTCFMTRSFKLMPGVASGQYVVESSLPAGVSMSPSVANFNIAGGSTQDISFNFNVGALAGQWVYGTVTLRNTSGDGRPDLKLPVAIFSEIGNIPDSISRTVATERGAVDVVMSGIVALNNPRFVATELVTPVLAAPSVAQDPTPDNPWDNANGTTVLTGIVPASPAGGSVPFRIRALLSSPTANDLDLFVGVDSDGTPAEEEVLCSSLSGDATEECVVTVMTASVPQTYWVMVQNYDAGASPDVANIEHAGVSLVAAANGTMTASGPGKVASQASFSVRLGYDDPTFLNGQRRFGYLVLQASPGVNSAAIPVTLIRNATGFSPFALANGVGRAVTLPGGAAIAHDRLYFDVPPHATSVRFTTTSAQNVDLYVARVPFSAASTIDPAPARNAANASAITGSGNETITVSGGALQAGRWYVTPANTSGTAANVTVTATIETTGAPPAFRSGHYFNPARSGHGAFIDFGGPQGAPDQWFMVWYTYIEDGTPTWYFAQAAAPGNNGIWRADLLRVVWNGSSASASDVGDVSVTMTGAESIAMSYNIDGKSGSETLSRLGAGGGCPTFNGQSLDTSGHWYSPSKSGFGYSYQVTSGDSPQEIFIPYVYDGQGFPRWLYGQRAFDGAVNNFSLQWFAGFAPTNPAVSLQGTAAGSGTRTLATNDIPNMSVNSTMTGLITGTWTENLPTALLSTRKLCQ